MSVYYERRRTYSKGRGRTQFWKKKKKDLLWFPEINFIVQCAVVLGFKKYSG